MGREFDPEALEGIHQTEVLLALPCRLAGKERRSTGPVSTVGTKWGGRTP